MAKQRFLITGGAGFMGINLIRYLLERGHEVRSYDIAPFSYPEADRVDVLQGDIREKGLHDRAFDGIDVVVHCAAALPLADPTEIHSTNVGGTLTLLETAEERGIARFIHISSTAVYGIPDHHPLTEDDRMHGVGLTANPRSRPSICAPISGPAACACRSCGRNPLSGRSGWAPSNCCMISPMTATGSRCWGRATTSIS